MSSIFNKIISGEIPCYKVAENDKFLAFLDINPLGEGHTLVIPKTETDYIFDIEDSVLAEMIIFSKKVAKAIKSVVPCAKIGVSVIGLEVPHAHIHLVPINQIKDLDFTKPRAVISKERYEELASLIGEAVIS